MSEYIYKIGDVLEDIHTGDKYLIIFSELEGFSQREYETICYDIHKTFRFTWLPESFLIKNTKRLGNIDISLLVGGKEEKKKWEVTDEDLPLILESLKEVGIDAKCDDSKDRLREDTENLLQDLKNCIDPNYQCCDCPYNEDCDTGRDELMKETIRILSLLLEKKLTYEYDTESKPIAKVINKELCDDGLKVTISTEDVKEENKKLKKEIEAMKEALDRQKHDNDIWRQGWFECLKSFGCYLNS